MSYHGSLAYRVWCFGPLCLVWHHFHCCHDDRWHRSAALEWVTARRTRTFTVTVPLCQH